MAKSRGPVDRSLFALPIMMALLVSCGAGGGEADNPCGLTPAGIVTDGMFSGSFRVTGVAASFPVQAELLAANRSLSAVLTSRDAVETFSGTLSCTIDWQGLITGTYTQTGTNSGHHVSGSVRGATNNQTACGTWSNSAGQEGTWQLTRETTGTSGGVSEFTTLPACQTDDDCSRGICFDCGNGACLMNKSNLPAENGRCWPIADCSFQADCATVGTEFGLSATCNPSLGYCQPVPGSRVSPEPGAGGAGGGGDSRISCTELPPAPAFTDVPLPCEVVAMDGGGAKCVTAHSTVRVIVPGYSGPLYQLCRGPSSPGPGSCKGTALDIMAKDGYADVNTHEAFCGAEACTISKIYDQSGMGNDLEPAPKGGAKTTPDNPSKASALPVTINGHRAYGLLIRAGLGYRSGCNDCTIKKSRGMALGDEPQTVYMLTSQNDLLDGCCFDYGNAETTSNDDGNGCMEAVSFGGGVVWGTGYGGKPGPWVLADLENGLFAGWENKQDKNISTNKPLKFDFVTAVLVGDTAEKNNGKGRFALYGADAQGMDPTFGKLTCMYDGIRPDKLGYNPMQKQGGLVLGTAGDNSSGGGGRFYEGATIAGPLVSNTTLAFLHAVIVAAKYQNAN